MKKEHDVIKWPSKRINHKWDQILAVQSDVVKNGTLATEATQETNKETKLKTINETREWEEVNWDGERICVTVRKKQLGFWGKSLVWFIHRIRDYQGFILKALWCLLRPPETLDTTVPVDATGKCVMHVKGSRSTCNSLGLMLQPSPASLCCLWVRKPHNCNNTVYSLHRLDWVRMISTVRLSLCCINVRTFGPLS